MTYWLYLSGSAEENYLVRPRPGQISDIPEVTGDVKFEVVGDRLLYSRLLR